MKKRYISLLLSFVLVLSMLPPVTYAADDVATIDVTETTAATEPSDTTEAVETTRTAETTQTTEATEATEATETTETTQATETTESTESTEPEESLVPDCSCNNAGIPAENHQDSCDLKMFYKNLCALSAQEIRKDWDKYPADGQDYILKYLSWTDQAKQKELEQLIALEPGQILGETPDGAEVLASGVPEGAQIRVAEASTETKAIVEAFVQEQGLRGAEQLFAWDISLCDADSAEIQPDGRVRVELEIPGKRLHKYATVYVIHVNDSGVAEKIPASVTEDGKVSFMTESFSTFAGFTVDFEFQGTQFSIPGGTSIKLSELFDQLKLPLYAADVADVAFTDEDLVTVTGPVNGDWVLTSLVAFTSIETLTITMNDGTVYEITVTDATYPTISYGTYGNLDGDVPGSVEWYLTGDTNGMGWNQGGTAAGAGWTEDYDIVIDGTNASDKNFEIVLQRWSGSSSRTLYLDLHTIWIKGGANVVFRLGKTITSENTDRVIIRQVRGYKNDVNGGDWWFGELFWVENGSLELKVPYITAEYADIRMTFDVDVGNLNKPSGNGPKAFVSLRSGAAAFKANRCDFINSRNQSAIVCRANSLTEFTMTDCSFGEVKSAYSGVTDNSCYSGGNAGAIYVRETTEDSNGYVVDIDKMTLTNVRFNGTTAGGSGGAVAIRGRVNTILFNGCSFQNCSAGNHGGAVCISDGDNPVDIDSVTFQNCTFNNCKINTTGESGRGGAIRCVFKNETPVTIDGTTFTGCSAGSHGGAVSVQGKLGDFTVKNQSSFQNCTAKGSRGGAIGVSCSKIGNISLSNSTFSGNSAGTLGGAVCFGNADSNTLTAGAVQVTGCTFTNNSAESVGGGLGITDGTYQSVTITNTSFSDCDTTGFGGGVSLKTNDEAKPFVVTGAVLIQNCDFDGCDGGSLSLEPWDHDGDPSTAEATTWDHDGDSSTPEIARLNGVSGGGAIAIGGTVGTSITIEGTSNAPGMFTNCATWNNGGAIAFLSDLQTPKITLDYLSIDACRARDAGNAIHLSSITVDSFELKNSTIQNCTYFTPGFVVDEDIAIPAAYASLGEKVYVAYDASGTFRSIGNTSTVALIDNCTFRNNGSYSNGGAVYWNANRIASRAGGAEIHPTLTLKHSVFDGNYTVRDGGGMYVEATVKVVGCEFKNNTAQERGGAIAQQVYDNTSRVMGEGEATNLALDANTSIHDNIATHGAGISITVAKTKSIPDGTTLLYPVKFTLGGASVFNNKATGNGGGIYYAAAQYPNDATAQAKVDNYQKEILIDNGKIYGNIAGFGADTAGLEQGGSGGGIYMSSNQTKTGSGTGYTKLTITGGHIYSNTATYGNGGGIYLTGKNASCTVTGGTIGGSESTANKATRYGTSTNTGCGGGIAISGGANITMSGGEISYNQGNFQGGGIWLDHKGSAADSVENTMSLSGGKILNNTVPGGNSSNGGGVYVGAHGDFTITDGEIKYNSANTGWGGGVYCYCSSVTIENGAIEQNSAGAGGGITLQYEANKGPKPSATITGGTVSYNTANTGGGMYIYYSCTVDVDGGTIEGNTAKTGSGGGIYANYYSTINVKNGTVTDNHADQEYGGGIYAYASTINVSGGSITGNTAYFGGGAGATKGSTITITGGDIYNNVAGGTGIEGNGGGIWAREGNVTVKGGNIYRNAASCGGGIAAEYNSTISVEGGDIYENECVLGGGIYARDSETTVDVKNGNIRDNVASSCGGGIHMEGCKVTVSGGTISGNESSRGGGVFVAAGGDLAVTDGFIINNTAVGMPVRLTTALKQNHMLAGTGGGVYVADGTMDDLCTFSLTGNKIAIYGNLADFAADDVFANGTYTQLTIPDVSGMSLEEYGGVKPEGWFEDYPADDSAYTSGLNLGTVTGITNGNVWRYRKAELGSQKAIVSTANGGLNKAQQAGTYVCMTLGIGSGSLTINKTADGPFLVPNQTFVFHVTGTPYDTQNERPVDLDVVVTVDENGNGQTVVSNLPYGVYTVTEYTDWSWRYTSTVSTKTPSTNVVVDKDNKDWVVNFTNTMTKEKWLSGAAYADNKFGIPND